MNEAKSKPKPGKIIRIDEETIKYVEKKRRAGERTTTLIRRLMGLPPKKGQPEYPTHYVLPSDLHPSVEEARGAAVLRLVRKQTEEVEEPLPVREVI